MEIIWTGLVLGLMGSFHCAGMCGPIALSLPLRGNNTFQKVFGGVLYNLGRTVTYGIMGAFFGLIGQGFHMVGFQRWISIAMGTFMITAILLPSFFKNFSFTKGDFFTGKLRKAIQLMFQKRSFGGLFFIGILNGLLPCGLVYMAIAGAIGTANLYYGIAFMVLFGLGTLPMMLFISLIGNMMGIVVRNKINKIIPYVVVFVGLIFILRGLNLGIPFLSPPAEKLNPEIHMKKMDEHSQKEAVKNSCCHPEE
jgi:sulfite exporter TauE/SafE